MKGLRSAAVVVMLLLPPLATAQEKAPDDPLMRLLARTEAKHAYARRNLERILREHPGFWAELQAVAARLQTHPAWLLNVMACESLFVAGARNPLPGQTASGLLQMIERTAEGLGTTTEVIRQMNPIEQLRLIEKYFAPFRGRLTSLADVYTATFRGFLIKGGDAAVAAPLDNSAKEQRIYALNRGLDLNHDGQITKSELALASLSIGRFQASPMPVVRTRSRHFHGNPAAIPNAEARNTAVRQTHSIYVR